VDLITVFTIGFVILKEGKGGLTAFLINSCSCMTPFSYGL